MYIHIGIPTLFGSLRNQSTGKKLTGTRNWKLESHLAKAECQEFVLSGTNDCLYCALCILNTVRRISRYDYCLPRRRLLRCRYCRWRLQRYHAKERPPRSAFYSWRNRRIRRTWTERSKKAQSCWRPLLLRREPTSLQIMIQQIQKQSIRQL